jgi:hypothetical protein
LQFSKVDELFESYKKFIRDNGINKLELIAEIKEYAEIFKANFNVEAIDSELPATSGIERINAIIFGLENTTLIPYVLFVLKNVDDHSEKNAIFDYLEAYIMRRMVCHSITKNYNQLFTDRLISNSILTRNDLKVYLDKGADKVNFMPTDIDLKNGFNNSKLINKQAAGILYLIETKIRNRAKHATGVLGLSRYSLEHIMPKKWENKWPKLSSPDAINERNRKLFTLGNLTIITASLNSSIRDGSWDVKKKGKGDKHGLIQYAAGLDTFSHYLASPHWDEVTIESRADFLYEYACKIWQN